MGVPVRRCVACRRTAPKTALVRLVVAEGAITVDTAPAPCGRGAYLCGRSECTDVALRRDGALLRRALRAAAGQVTVDGARLAALQSSRERQPTSGTRTNGARVVGHPQGVSE